MSVVINLVGGGVDTSDANVGAAEILDGKIAYVDGEKVVGTMPNNGAQSQELTAGGSFSIPKGYHDGTGKITAKDLASQTVADALITDVAEGKTAYVNGEKITGLMKNGDVMRFGTPPPPKASLAATPGTEYTNGLNGLEPAQIAEVSKSISDNAEITNVTEVVYIDWAAMGIHRKLNCGMNSDQVTIDLNGTGYLFDIIGFNHDTLTSSTAYGSSTATGKAGITLQMHDLWSEYKQMNSSNTNSGSWRTSMMRTQTMPQMRGYMPSGWQSVLKKVNKVTSIGGGAKSGLETTSDDLFLLTEGEIFGPGWGYAGSGYACDDEIPATPQYAWYKAGNSKIKKKSGSANYWWERSPISGNTNPFCRVNSGGSADYFAASNSYGVAFGFCV